MNVPLLPEEDANFHDAYKKYYIAKRQNFFQSIAVFRQLWECFQLLNDIWERGIDDIAKINDQFHMLPSLLFYAARARFLVAVELGFSCCIGDAYSILRDGIELVTHAHKIFKEPTVTSAWSEKHNGEAELKAYDRIFTYDKKKNLYPDEHGLRQLHTYYAQFCEMATHSTVTSLGKSFTDISDSKNLQWGFHYFEIDPRKLAVFLFTLLQASAHMEEAFFGCFEPRLKLDHVLVEMRERFSRMKEEQRVYLKTTYKLDTV
jgi:hypothetical protein